LKPRHLRDILEEAGAPMAATTNKHDLIAFTLRSATSLGDRRVPTKKQRRVDVPVLLRLLDELLPEGRRRTAEARRIGYMDECPEAVQHVFSPPATDA